MAPKLRKSVTLPFYFFIIFFIWKILNDDNPRHIFAFID